MGEHQTWLDFLDRSWWARELKDTPVGATSPAFESLFGPSHFTLIHSIFAALVVLFVLYVALRFHRRMTRGGQAALVPPRRLNLQGLFELLCDTVLMVMEGVMDAKSAKRFFPLIASLAFFILFNNALALIPGMGVPTTTLKTNLGLALIVFFATHFYGVREHGFVNYFKHFLGPIAVLAPLFFVIEVISHLVRPISLSVRLLGNMFGDHKVIFIFFSLVPFLIPVPFLLLGVLVAVIQTLVFCLLATIYISLAIAHDH